MIGRNPQTTPREIVDDVLGRGRTREIWGGSYDKVLPVTVGDFELSAVLSAVFFMFRFGYRRGKGKFLDTFADGPTAENRRKIATIESITRKLAQAKDRTFAGFEDETTRAILGDLLLCFCLENSKRSLGRSEKVQRVAPAHYMAS